jgi:hypothetical protein
MTKEISEVEAQALAREHVRACMEKYKGREEELDRKWASFLEGVEEGPQRIAFACLLEEEAEYLKGLSTQQVLDKAFGPEEEPS